jgi:hypothetical protein
MSNQDIWTLKSRGGQEAMQILDHRRIGARLRSRLTPAKARTVVGANPREGRDGVLDFAVGGVGRVLGKARFDDHGRPLCISFAEDMQAPAADIDHLSRRRRSREIGGRGHLGMRRKGADGDREGEGEP